MMMCAPMDRVSNILTRFELMNSSRVLTSDVIGHVLPRAPVVGGRDNLFSYAGAAKIPPCRTRPPSITIAQTKPSFFSLAARPAPVAPQQTSLNYLMETLLSRRMHDVAVCTSKNANPVVSQETSPQATTPKSTCPGPTRPLPQRPSRTVPSVKTIRSTAPGTPKFKRKRIRLKTARRREQCRMNQARYREKQIEYTKNLAITVYRLQLEIPMLEMQHSRLISTVKSSARSVVADYFHLFRNGTRNPDQIPSGPGTWLQKTEAKQQLVFLRSSMAVDVMLGERRGVDALVEQWKRYTSYFDDLQFQLEHMATVSEDLITATALFNVTISESTLQHIFPHLLTGIVDREDIVQNDKAARLGSKLLGKRLFLPCRMCFEWDETTQRIARMDSTVDMLPSLTHVLGSIEDAAFVLERAFIAQDGSIGLENQRR